jgi:putative oxidoreductase
MDLALIVLRLTVGLLLVGHGAQKLFGWFGGHGLNGTAQWSASIGFRPARAWALLAGILELGGGLLFTLGMFTPLGSLGIGASMLTAIAKVHWPKLWVTEGGLELPLVNLAVVIAVGLIGPGVVSLDNAFGTALPPNVSFVGVGLIIAGWFFALIVSTLTAVESSASNK